jgi:N-acyl-D-aspartate/D-glutamate deacylase
LAPVTQGALLFWINQSSVYTAATLEKVRVRSVTEHRQDMSSTQYDTLIRNGRVFDGRAEAPLREDIAIRDGRIAARGADLNGATARTEIDARGKWVMPGMLDIHTHLDLEVEVNPGLEEVVRHGTTTVVVGNCSLGAAFGAQRKNGENPIVDCFARVENIPKEVLQRCADRMTWNNTADYLAHFSDLPLGPNIAPLIPHSMLRIEVMGVDDAVQRHPDADELGRMQGLLTEAMQQGYPGFSTDGLPFHYLANDPHKDKRVPTQYATMAEMKSLLNIVRAHDRVWQATPDSHDRLKTLRWFLLTSGRLYGKPLRTSALTAIDPVADRNAWKLFLKLARFFNSRLLDGKFHFQVLSAPFKVWGDGVAMPAFEEIPSTCRLIAHELYDREGRAALLDDPAFRDSFISDWNSAAGSLSMARGLQYLYIDSCPIEEWSGRSFAAAYQRLAAWQAGDLPDDQLAAGERDFFSRCINPIGSEGSFVHALLRAFDRDLRWWSVTANDRPDVLRKLLWDKHTLPGFNDSGAHLTNMAFFDGNLTTLQMAQQESERRVAQAVRRLTRDPAEFFGLDVGTLDQGAQADIVVIDPEALAVYDSNASRRRIFRDIFEHEQLVNRSDGVVSEVLIAGEAVWREREFQPPLGERRLGRALTAGR